MPGRSASAVSRRGRLALPSLPLFSSSVNVNAHRSPPIASKSPWPKPRTVSIWLDEFPSDRGLCSSFVHAAAALGIDPRRPTPLLLCEVLASGRHTSHQCVSSMGDAPRTCTYELVRGACVILIMIFGETGGINSPSRKSCVRTLKVLSSPSSNHESGLGHMGDMRDWHNVVTAVPVRTAREVA